MCLNLRRVLGCFPSLSRKTNLRQEKKSTKINFRPETAGWGGGLAPEVVGVEEFVPYLESLSSLGFEERNLGCPGNFARLFRTPGAVQKVCANKFVRIFRSLKPETSGTVRQGLQGSLHPTKTR